MSWKYHKINAFNPTPELSLQSSNDKRWLEQLKTTDILLDKFTNSMALILGDEVGMGKTWIGLLTAMSIAKEKRVLIITPNKVLANQWRSQYLDLINRKFTEKDKKEYLKLLINKDPFFDFNELLKVAVNNPNGIFITNFGAIDPTDPYYSYVNKMKENGFFELLIIDEGHKLKNSFTEKYQIFKVVKENQGYRAPLNLKFNRLLIMTATPFQLNHKDLEIILGIADSANATEEMKNNFTKKVENLITQLNRYKNELENFEKKFKKIKLKKDVSLLEDAILQGKDLNSSTNSKIRDAAIQFRALEECKSVLNSAMKDFIIRNTKTKEKRKNIQMPIQITDNSKLTFFLGDSLQTAKIREDKAHHQAAILTSSFNRFDDLFNSNNSSAAVRHYSELVKKLKDHAFKESEHPKIELVINHAFNNWLHGHKTLIFAFYAKTIEELNSKLQKKISDHINTYKNQFTRDKIEHFLNDIGQSDKILSLVFRDNPFGVTLLPLLKSKLSDDGINHFLILNDEEKEDLTDYIARLKYPKTSHNYFKLLMALCHVYFKKFQKDHGELINNDLLDDFKEFSDPEAIKIKALFPNNKVNDSIEESFKKKEIPDILRHLINDQERIKEILFYPSIWINHREQVENLAIEMRLKLTEVVWSYLTSDEFIFLELLHEKKEIPSIEEFSDIYFNSKLSQRESTFSKIQRLLDNAKEMAPDNLEILLGDIAHRYNPNKRNVGKIIVETVSGLNSADEKHRSVTAFKTPLAPNILISSPVLTEGVDLHTECNDIVHYDHEWNPANLEQKIGRLDRVGSKGERLNRIDIHYPYIAGTQDEKAFNVVMARKSWFGAVMGEKYEDKWKVNSENETALELPESLQERLIMKLGNESH